LNSLGNGDQLCTSANGFPLNSCPGDLEENCLARVVDANDCTDVQAPHGDKAQHPVGLELQAAIRRWVLAAADRYNDGHHWPHPTSRRAFPPPVLHTATIVHDQSKQ